MSRKQVGAFDGAASELEHANDLWDQAVKKNSYAADAAKRFKSENRLAARLLKVAGRVGVLKLNGQSGTDYLFDGRPDDESKIARIIHRAQTLQGKSK